MFRRPFFIILKAIIAAGLVYWVWRAGYLEMAALKKLLRLGPFSVLTTIVFLSVVTAAIRLAYLTRELWPALQLKQVFQLTLIGTFFNYGLPGGTGGDVVKALMVAQKVDAPRLQALGVVVLDRLIGLFSMCCLGVVALLFSPEVLQKPIVLLISSVLVGIIFACLFVFYVLRGRITVRWMEPTVQRLKSSFSFLELMNQKVSDRSIFLSFLLSVSSQVFIVLSLFYSGKLLHLDEFSLATYFVVGPAGLVFSSVPITPAGIGIAQVAFVSLFKIYTDAATDVGSTTITIYQILLFIVSLLGMYYYIVSDFRILRQREKNS